MWEPGSNSSYISKTASNRDIILLAGALIFCFGIYQVWGPLLIITCCLIFVLHTCYSLYVHDSLFAPHTLVLVKYAGKFSLQLAQTAKILTFLGLTKSIEIFVHLKNKYQEKKRRFLEVEEEDDMNGRQRNVYRLSTQDADYAEQSTPTSNDPYHLFALNGACNNSRCSTPIPRGGLGGIWKKETQQNGGLGLLKHPGTSPIRRSPSMRSENRQPGILLPRNEETLYSPKGSPWGNSISPKMEKSPAGKAIQTVAGPLLASTRFNIDPKIYTDVSSPGITSRITKYAAEANCKLTHQPQYGPGQFPKVNLNAMPTPLISPKTSRARVPVTVRVAPPDLVNYNLHDSHTFQDRHKLFSNTSGSEIKEAKSCPTVNQVLKEISLKRHASREDMMLDLVKKQRTERIAEGQLENLEEMMQKRARDESSNSEDDQTPKKSQRPTKRSKSSSCHDILNSLSSSVNVYSGVKRKAMDSFHSESPENEKHFKPSSKSPNSSLNLKSSPRELSQSKEQLNVIMPVVRVPKDLQTKSPEKISVNAEINKISPEKKNVSKAFDQSTPKLNRERETVITKTTKLEDKLFMKADPQPNRKLKILAEEQTTLEAQFQTDDKDEIKKQDIDNMKQNSMRLRLQSMYDAISGKSSSKIDPDVVIQAEEVNSPPVSTNYATLNSLTSTTTVNTSPITTTIVPILKSDTDGKSSTPKHVTFNLPSGTSSFSSTSTTLSTLSSDTNKTSETKTVGTEPSASTTFAAKSTSPVPTFSFGSNAVSTSTTAAKSSANTSVISGFSFNSNSSTTTTADNKVASSTNVTSTPVSTSLFSSKPASENLNSSFNTSSYNMSFGTNTKPTTSSTPTASTTFSQNTELNKSQTSGFGNANTFLKSSTVNAVAQPSAPLSTFVSDKKEGFTFGTPAASVASNTPTTTTSTTTAMSSAGLFGNNSFSTVSSAATTAPAPTTSAAPIFSFGAGANKTTENTGGFNFNATTTSGISFGTNVPTTAATGFGITPSASSNAPAAVSAFGNQAPSLFNAPSNNTPSLFSGSLNPSSVFKSPNTTTAATTTPSVFGATTSPSTGFGVPAAAAVASTSTAPSLFGNNTNNSTIPSLFQNTANPTTTTAATPSLTGFGGPTQPQNTQGSVFGSMPATTTPSIFGASATPAPSTTVPSIFGASATPAPSTGLFSGGNSSSPAVANMGATTNEGTSIFGQTKSPASPFGASNSSFGTSNSTFSAPATNSSNFTIGSAPASTGLPSFGTIKPTMQFGGPTNTAQATSPTSGSIFGATTNTGFGGPANTGGFGSPSTANVGSTFGNPAPSASSAFGTSSFGNSTAPAATSPFGAQSSTPATTSNIFGNTSNNTGSASFSFGGASQGQQNAQQQPPASFSFGGSSSAAPNTGGVFQFGAGAQSKPAGFNFSAPPGAPTINFTGAAAAPTAFNAPTNMFSIGSGSASRSRTTRQRRQR